MSCDICGTRKRPVRTRMLHEYKSRRGRLVAISLCDWCTEAVKPWMPR